MTPAEQKRLVDRIEGWLHEQLNNGNISVDKIPMDELVDDLRKKLFPLPEKLTFDEVMARYEELANRECDYRVFDSWYLTDNDGDNRDEKPYKVKNLYCACPLDTRTENKKFVLSQEQKEKLKNIIIEKFNKENIYSL